jgi:hypothetical protein
MKMKQALEKVQATKRVAETEVAGDFRTRPGREMMRQQAKQSLPAVRAEFQKEFKKVGFPIFVSGPGAEKFTDLALEQAEGLVVDFRSATQELRDATKQTVGPHKEFTLSSFTVMLREIRQLAANMGLASIPMPTFEGTEVANTGADVDKIVDRYLMKYFGPEFLGGVVSLEAYRQAESLSGDSPVVPVVILGVPADQVDRIGAQVLQGKFTVVNATNDVDEKTVTKTFKEVKALLKN